MSMRLGKPFSKKHTSGKYAAGENKSGHAMEEFGPGRKEFIFCPKGEAVYYKKSWHHTNDFFRYTPNLKKEKGIRFLLCPVHEMVRNKQYEGEIRIRNIPQRFQKELAALVKNMGERAVKIDVLDRILDLKIEGQTLTVTTSENQLAQKIARKIAEVFEKHAHPKVSHGKEGDVIRVAIDFL